MKFELVLLAAIALVFGIPIVGAVYLKIAEDKGKRYQKRKDHNPYLEYLHSKNELKNICKKENENENENEKEKDKYLKKVD